MAYKTEDLKKKAIEAIKKNKMIFFIEDVSTFIAINKSTFYAHFPTESDDYKELLELLGDNRTEMKAKIRHKLAQGDRAAELLALYRLIATPEERQSLNQSYIDHSTKGDKINSNISVNVVKPLDDDE